MKYNKPFLNFVMGVLVLFSCTKSYLNVPPIGSLQASDLANNKGVQSLLIATYSLLDGQGSQSNGAPSAASNWVYGSICGSEAHKGSYFDDQTDIVAMETFVTTPNISYLSAKWQAIYEGIFNANEVLRIMRKATDMKPVDTLEVRAETLFLRAYYHFEAKKMWNKIPFIDESVTYVGSNYHVANDTNWSHIENDFDTAIRYLPKTQNNIGRVNIYAAEAFLAKVYMFEHKYQMALSLLNDVISNGETSSGKPYKLNEYYFDNFNAVYKNNSESVFAVQSSVNDGSAGINGNFGDATNYPAAGNAPGQCCGFFQPSQYLVNHFKTDSVSGLPDLDHFNDLDVLNDDGIASSDPFTPYKGTLDPRLDWTVGRRGIPYLDWGIEPGADWVNRGASSFGPYVSKKNVYYKSQQGVLTDNTGWILGSTANNVNLIRFADVLLWAAEAEILSPGGVLERARGYVNLVRQRAANPVGWVHNYVNIVDPSQGSTDSAAANYRIGMYTTSWTDREFALKAVQYERILELGMEGHRFFDLVRWNIASESINDYLQKEGINRSYLKNAHFTQNKNEYFAIPQDQIDLSADRDGVKKLIQNPGY